MRALFLRDRRPFDEVLMSHLPGLKIFKTKFHHFLEGNLASELEGNLASELEGNMASELEGAIWPQSSRAIWPKKTNKVFISLNLF